MVCVVGSGSAGAAGQMRHEVFSGDVTRTHCGKGFSAVIECHAAQRREELWSALGLREGLRNVGELRRVTEWAGGMRRILIREPCEGVWGCGSGARPPHSILGSRFAC